MNCRPRSDCRGTADLSGSVRFSRLARLLIATQKSKRAGQKPYARLEDDIPKLIWKSYLAGAFVGGVVGTAFVLLLLLLPLSLQPVTVPITSPNSTIRVNSLFIVGVTLTNSEKRTSKNFALFLRHFLGYLPTRREQTIILREVQFAVSLS
jgi:hypothetical protein